MSADRIDRLDRLRKLRARLVDRCASEAAAAVGALDAAKIDRDRAAIATDRAAGALAAAVCKRLARPGDALVEAFVERCALDLDAAKAALATATTTLVDAESRLAAARQRWLRASARHDVLVDLCRRARTHHRRATDRRMSDDANERLAARGGTAWA